MKGRFRIVGAVVACATQVSLSIPATAQDGPESFDYNDTEPESQEATQESQDTSEEEELRVSSATTVRRFHQVLDELLAEFGYDIKTGDIKGLENIALRKVSVSEALPHSYKKYMKMLVSERIMDNADIKVLNCIPCEGKTSRVVEGKFIITSPATNVAELKLAAKRLGIANFMDVILVYHSTHMVLGVEIFDIESNELVWSRSYNSETIKSRYQKLAIDYSQIAKSRESDEYEPEYRILVGAGGASVPNLGSSDSSAMLSIEIRSTEKFNNRKSEFGMMLTLFSSSNSLLSEYPSVEGTGGGSASESTDSSSGATATPAEPEPFTTAIVIGGLYSHNFLGSVESYDQIRQGVHLMGGGLVASGYMAPIVRAGWDVFFGRRYVLTVAGLFVAPSKILLDNDFVETQGGGGAEAILSYNF